MRRTRDRQSPTAVDRRTVIAGLAAAGAVAAAGSARGQEPPKPQRIVLNDSGGAMGNHMRRIFAEPFEKQHGIRVVQTSPVDFGKLRAMVDSGNVEWTVTEIGGQDAIRAMKLGLVLPIDDTIVDRSKFPEKARTSHAYTSSVYSTVIGYRTDVFKGGTHPKNWAEWWNVAKFPGPRSMRNHPVDNLEFALLADGVSPDKLYPIDLDRAFKKLDQIKPHVTVWWTTGAQPAQLLLDKEVVLATGWNGRFYDLAKKDKDVPVAVEWGGGSLKQGTFVIPKGAKDAYWGQKFLATMADPKNQAMYANALGYPGPSLESLQYVDKDVLPNLPTAPENLPKQFWLDDAWWSEHGAVAGERWNQWMLKRA